MEPGSGKGWVFITESLFSFLFVVDKQFVICYSELTSKPAEAFLYTSVLLFFSHSVYTANTPGEMSVFDAYLMGVHLWKFPSILTLTF